MEVKWSRMGGQSINTLSMPILYVPPAAWPKPISCIHLRLCSVLGGEQKHLSWWKHQLNFHFCKFLVVKTPKNCAYFLSCLVIVDGSTLNHILQHQSQHSNTPLKRVRGTVLFRHRPSSFFPWKLLMVLRFQPRENNPKMMPWGRVAYHQPQWSPHINGHGTDWLEVPTIYD